MRYVTKLLAVIAVLAIALIPFVADAGSDAVPARTGPWEASGFTDNGGGSLRAVIQNDVDEEVVIVLKVLDFGDDRVYTSKTVTLLASSDNEGKTAVELNWSYGSAGTKYVKVYAYDQNGQKLNYPLVDDGCVEINVTHSIWKNAATYIVIVIVVIIVIVVLVLYMRTTKKTRADTTMEEKTFTKLHNEKVAKKSTAAAKKTEYKSEGKKARKSK